MDKEWSLREEFYRASHRWPSMLALILIGGLIGWGLSFIWPTYYRAASQIYIALNPYRKFSDTIFEALANPKYSNLDNYHYWQMSQLDSAIFLDQFLEQTLELLRQEDAYWEQVNTDQLGSMLDAEWRSSGTWTLIANHPEALRASQAARAWSAVVVEKVSQAVDSARETSRVDQQLMTNEKALEQLTRRLREVAAARRTLQAWKVTAQEDSPESVPPYDSRWALLQAITRLADFSPAWMKALETQPPAEATSAAYLEWFKSVDPLLEAEEAALQDQIAYLEGQKIELASRFAVESRKSLSFSPNLEIKRKEDLEPRPMRASMSLILIGGAMGLLIWLLGQLVIITRAESHK
jgi:type II secretory pathway pseudopilin PulG